MDANLEELQDFSLVDEFFQIWTYCLHRSLLYCSELSKPDEVFLKSIKIVNFLGKKFYYKGKLKSKSLGGFLHKKGMRYKDEGLEVIAYRNGDKGKVTGQWSSDSPPHILDAGYGVLWVDIYAKIQQNPIKKDVKSILVYHTTDAMSFKEEFKLQEYWLEAFNNRYVSALEKEKKIKEEIEAKKLIKPIYVKLGS